MKNIAVAVTNDLTSDQRVKKVCDYLTNKGYTVHLVGRNLKDSQAINREYSTHRMNLFFTKSALFYAEFNFRLFFHLLFKKTDVILANDLDTLLACFIVAKLKGKEIVYDSHEYFTEVPEIQGRKIVKKTWTAIEAYIFPKLKKVITVNESISSIYKDKYKVDVKIVRNIPPIQQMQPLLSRKDLNIPLDKKLIILQGAGINMDRGAEELVEAMRYVDNAILYIIGKGDVFDLLKSIISKNNIETKVKLIGRLPYQDMMQYTRNADLGISIDKATNLNYLYSLPNKLFDYIHAGIPVLTSNMVEVANIVELYQVGIIIDNHKPTNIANAINRILDSDTKIYKANCLTAMKDLTWQNEEKILDEIYTF